MLKAILTALSQLRKRNVIEKRSPLTGDQFCHDALVFALGPADAAELERRLDDSNREQAYRDHVLRMERMVELRERELAAKTRFESLP